MSKGPRPSMLLGAGFCAAACALHCITIHNPAATILTHIAQIFNGLAGPVSMSIGPVFSAAWFPSNQRITATALIAVSNYVGIAFSFLVGPAMVGELSKDATSEERDRIGQELLRYMYTECAFAAVVLILTVAYFPNYPPNLPSVTAGHARESFGEGFWKLFRNRSFWIASISYGVVTGVFSGWSAYLLPNLEQFLSREKAQSESGWLGFYAILSGCVSGVIMSRVADRLGGKMKLMLVVMNLLGGGFAIWFSLMCTHTLPFRLDLAYISSIACGCLVNASMPLFFEIAVEVAYPISEATTTTMLTTMNNVFCLVFLLMPDVPHLGNAWVNWTLVGACLTAGLLMTGFRENYRRLTIDAGTKFEVTV
ncbi:uncharacterized protein MONBRDRAFT_27200 [Monosiga brevicollis MX1]|uniref:Major facilitator superfamily (MFS) profile domain-containing protein n=1 Tax=Monosiga brevicollis TaxID=81824 RepID=A9V4L3_MONBE|nr:uncharacterized protein MONBRDRAFT_27200 [Monosiga brevicollis MX1]EDQ87390.1 predicted protein [Monosiga brevicollis MX1]|eukprot:XP_001747650.1 hypothetical protein [Monosiga brevicollis MX1]